MPLIIILSLDVWEEPFYVAMTGTQVGFWTPLKTDCWSNKTVGKCIPYTWWNEILQLKTKDYTAVGTVQQLKVFCKNIEKNEDQDLSWNSSWSNPNPVNIYISDLNAIDDNTLIMAKLSIKGWKVNKTVINNWS